ncbi:ABC transporter substrate-binding protein [Actinomadura livida]|uniref:ABC-type branched-subunit amino acid transport system substrate-binding protein n=1 Tax=Actinomadura livida TaxID=79909 RepID=A0A7W7IFE4_9ACTN|nr:MULTISPECIES: ABC transporter substrate-binding protein [Actinomadura]MBB4775996.1 ABC-type branched-subunit amino acid transport system substrate-binding protein [Actinomadura catellatispora]GGU16233.1 ABC transporter substrate-binding protein [Actinomadura livida]
MRRILGIAALAALAAATATACSDSAAESEYGKNLTGEPVKLSVIASGPGPIYQPELLKAAKAAVNAVNDAGGVKPGGGEARPLELVHCEASTVTDPNAATKCAREAIDQKVVAGVGKYVSSDAVVQAFQGANIPLVGTMVQTGQDFTNPASFPIIGGSPVLSAGTGIALQKAGAKTVAVVTGDSPSGRLVPQYVKALLESPGDLKGAYYLPFDASADLTSNFSEIAAANPDGVALLASTDVTSKTIVGLRQAGYKGKISVVATAVSEGSLAKTGEAGEGTIVVSDYEPVTSTSNPKIKQFLDEMKKYGDGEVEGTEFALNAWASVHLVADRLNGVSEVSGAALMKALEGSKVSLGIAPDFTYGEANFLKLPRIPRATVQFQTVEGGKIMAPDGGEFTDLNQAAKK